MNRGQVAMPGAPALDIWGKRMRILIVEDDSKVSYWLVSKLQACGHHCTLVDNGRDAVQAVSREAFDVMVLDRMLPIMDGMQVLEYLRDRRHPPILVLSAVDQPDDRVSGLRAGADDYLGKPFHFSELLARIDVLARRNRGTETQAPLLCLEDLCMDVLKREVRRGGQLLDLTDKEFKLLQVLLEHSGQVVTRTMLLQKVWGYEFDPQTNLIDVHMSKLRAKLDKRFGPPLLRTIRSVGYALG